MIESPLLQEVLDEVASEAAAKAVAEQSHRFILRFIERRFGTPPADLIAALTAIKDEKVLEDLLVLAATCSDLNTFRAALSG